MEIKIYKNINECHKLWEKFSPTKSLFDVWDFRQCFYNKEDNKPYFITGRERGKIVGVVPLCFIESKNQYAYFGGWFPERNSFFVRDKTKLGQLLEQCPYNTCIEGIDPAESNFYNLLEDEHTYFIDLLKYDNDFDKYFGSFSKKRQKNFKRELKNIPPYKVHHNRLKDFKRLVQLNIMHYDKDSVFHNDTIKNGLHRMMKLANRNKLLEMISVEINGKTEAVDIGVLFGKWYHVITGSSNNNKIPNLGKLITVLSIKNAISKKARYVDFFASSGYWKDMWSFEKEMLLKFTR